MFRILAPCGVVALHILGACDRRGSLGFMSKVLISVCFAVPLFVFMFGMTLALEKEHFPRAGVT